MLDGLRASGFRILTRNLSRSTHPTMGQRPIYDGSTPHSRRVAPPSRDQEFADSFDGLPQGRQEFFRQPDQQFTGEWVQYISMGQILSIPMVLAGIIMMVWAYRRRPQQQTS